MMNAVNSPMNALWQSAALSGAAQSDGQTPEGSFEALLKKHQEAVQTPDAPRQDAGDKAPPEEQVQTPEGQEPDANKLSDLAAAVTSPAVFLFLQTARPEATVPGVEGPGLEAALTGAAPQTLPDAGAAQTPQQLAAPEAQLPQSAVPPETAPVQQSAAPAEAPQQAPAADGVAVEEVPGARRQSASADDGAEQQSGGAMAEPEQPLFGKADTVPVKVGEAPALDTRTGDLEAKLARQVTDALEQGETRLELRLSPANLGTVTVELTRSSDGALRVMLSATGERALSLLEQHSAGLQSLLAAGNGQSTVQVEVQRQQAGQQAQQNPFDQEGGGRQQQEQQHHQRQDDQEGERDQDFLQKLRLGLIHPVA